MSDGKAPERIWTDGPHYWVNPTFKDIKTEYIRADVHAAAIKQRNELQAKLDWLYHIRVIDAALLNTQMKRAEKTETENERLREALIHLRGLYDCSDVVDAALEEGVSDG